MYLKSENLKVLLIGPFGYSGGVSIHMDRLVKLLKNDISFFIIEDTPISVSKDLSFNIRIPSNFLRILKEINNNDIIHIHSGNWILRIFFVLLGTLFRKKIILTIHSFRLNFLQKIFTYLAMFSCHKIIVVNHNIKNELPKFLEKKLFVKEAFIPPFLDKKKSLDKKFKDLIKINRNKKNILLCANAFRITLIEGKDLYGIDQTISLAKYAKENKLPIFIIYIIANIISESEQELLKKYLKIINKDSLENYINIINDDISFVNLIKECDIVLRPTLSDGDSLTVREGIWFNKLVIASDVSKRPEKTILYKTGDSLDLFKKVKKSVKLKSNTNKSFYSMYDNLSTDYLNIYKQCYN